MAIELETTERVFPLTDSTLEALEATIEAARRQYRRDYDETTLDKTGWCTVEVIDGVLTLHYTYIGPRKDPS